MAHIKILDGRSHVWQWDTSIAIRLVGSDADELHFANEGSETAYFRVLADGECNIPNICLQTPGQLRVYAFKDGHYTDDSFRIQIVAREKPSDYIEPEREAELVDALEDRLSVNERFIGNTADRVSENNDFIDNVERALKSDNDFIEKTRGYSFSNGRGPGKRLNDYFNNDSELLGEVIRSGDFSKINVGDYWETPLAGTFSLHGTYVARADTTLYDDPDLTTVYGLLENQHNVVPDATQNKSALIRLTPTVSKYCSWNRCDPAEKTLGERQHPYDPLDPIIVRCYVGAINPRLYYGNRMTTISYGVNHVLFYMPDVVLVDRMLRDASTWENMTTATKTVEYPTDWHIPLANTVVAVYTVRLNGVTLTENTDYTVTVFTDPHHHQWTRVNLQAAAGAVAGDTLTIDYALDGTAWNHTAIYNTLNANDGLIHAFADDRFAGSIWNQEILQPSVFGNGELQWVNRGKLFIPTETETFGTFLKCSDGAECFLPQFECFIGSMRMTRIFDDFTHNPTSNWLSSFASKKTACCVNMDGTPGAVSVETPKSFSPFFIWG